MTTPAPNLFDGHASLVLKEEDQKVDEGSKVAGSAPAEEAGEMNAEQPAGEAASTAVDAAVPPSAGVEASAEVGHYFLTADGSNRFKCL